MTLREQILAQQKSKPVSVTVPEWGGLTVWVHPLNGKQLADWAFASRQRGGGAAAIAEQNADLITRCVRDGEAADAPLTFTGNDIDALVEKDAAPLNRIVRAAQKLNSIGDDAEDKAAKKPVTPSGDSGSA